MHTVFVLRSPIVGILFLEGHCRSRLFRHGKELTCSYTDERPGLSRELPNSMFDENYNAGVTLGQPEISIAGLNELASVLASLNANRKRGAQSAQLVLDRRCVGNGDR
jgi:hypothetical protein